MKEVLEVWFTGMRENYANAVRFSFLLVAFLLVVHLTTFNQYLRTQRNLPQAKREVDDSKKTKETAEQIDAAAQALAQISNERFPELLMAFVRNLTNDFARLGKEIHAIQDGLAQPDAGIGIQEDAW